MSSPVLGVNKKVACVVVTFLMMPDKMINDNRLIFVKRVEDAKIPTQATTEAAGWDLYAMEDVVLEPWNRKFVSTGLSAHSPPNTYMRIAPRSSHAVHHGIDVMAGVIDRDYQGEIIVVLMNLSNSQVTIPCVRPIAQLIVESYQKCTASMVSSLEFDTVASERGALGFGSSDTDKAIVKTEPSDLNIVQP